MKHFLLKRLWIIILLPISIIFLLAAKNNSWIAENIFAKGISKYFAQLLSSITGIVPFSIAEIVIIISPIVVICIVVFFIVKIIRSNDKAFFLYKSLVNIVCILSVLMFMFTLFDGINYYRYDFSYYAGISPQKSTKEELYMVGMDIVNKCNVLRKGHISDDSNGVFTLDSSFDDVSTTADSVNDIYLKANGENEGVKSYGLMIDLLVAQYRSEGFFDNTKK